MDSGGIYMVTGATVHKEHIFTNAEKLVLLESELLQLAKVYQWQLEAWAVFVNHYHFVARGCSEEKSLKNYVHQNAVKHGLVNVTNQYIHGVLQVGSSLRHRYRWSRLSIVSKLIS